MLRGLPHSFEKTAVPLSFFQHIKEPVFLFPCSMFKFHAVRWNRGGGLQSSPRVSVSQHPPVDPFAMCIYFYSAELWLLSKTTTATISFRNSPFWLFLFENRSQIVDLSFLLHAWTDLITCIQFSLFIQLALCFTRAVLFMEVTFCGCSYKVEIPKLEAVLNSFSGKACAG